MIKSKILIQIIFLIGNLILLKIINFQLCNFDVFKIHVFLFFVFLFGELIQKKVSKNKKTISIYFLVVNFTRIVLCILFLLPTILNYNNFHNIFIYNFFIVYFFYLVLDIIFIKIKGDKLNF